MGQDFIHITYPLHLPVNVIYDLYSTYMRHTHIWHLATAYVTHVAEVILEWIYLVVSLSSHNTSVISSTVLNQNFCLLQSVIRAPRDGQVEKIYFHIGEKVSKDVVVIKFVKEGGNDQNTV